MFDNLLVRRAGAAVIAAALICSAEVRAQPSEPQTYELPSQDLDRALREVAARTGRNLIVASGLVAGRRSPRLRGRYTTEQALAALLAGSGLAVRAVNGGFVVVPLAAAQDVGDEVATASADIVVTGTRIRGAQPTSPIINVTRDQIDRSGASSVEQLMRQVPQNFAGGVNQENFAIPGAGVDVTEHGAGVNLRGLGQRATLVLLNGRRLAPSGVGSFVDVSLIPLSAVERVEILTDGASAIYGSDAVGGVVNFILRDRFEGFESVAQIGSTTEGDGDQFLAGATAGRAWSSGRAMLSYEFRGEDEIRAGDRDYTINLNPDHFLFPRERRHSLLGVVGQSLTDRLKLELTGIFADRHTERSFFFSGTPIGAFAVADARSAGLAGDLSYDLGGSWRAVLSGNYFVARTEQDQNQPGGEGLLNSLDTRNAVLETGLKADGTLFRLPGGAVRIAVGGQVRREDYRDLFETQVNAPTVRSDQRTIGSLFGEVYVPIVGSENRRPALERLVVTAAARLEDYDAYDVSLDPKLGLLWSPIRDLSLRASYDTSFRAPLLSETTGFYNAFYFPAALVFIDPAEAPAGAALALVGSNPDIRPERSRTWTVGGEYRPERIGGLSLTANYYSIRFSNRIALPTPQIVIVGDPAFEGIVTRDPSLQSVNDIVTGAGQVLDFSGPNFTPGGATPADVAVIVDARFNNTAETRTNGLDLGLRYDVTLGRNAVTFDLNANHIFEFEDRLTPTSPAVSTLDTPYRPVDWRARGAVGWRRDGWSGSLAINHAGAYRDNRTSDVRRVDGFTTFDLSLAYVGERGPLRGTRVGLTAQNLFDTDPPLLLPDPGLTSGLGYDPVNATGRGRIIALQLRRTW